MSDLNEYVIALLLGVVIVVSSLGGAVLMSAGPNPLIGRELGAAWAWALGSTTGLWVIPWAKKSVRSIQEEIEV